MKSTIYLLIGAVFTSFSTSVSAQQTAGEDISVQTMEVLGWQFARKSGLDMLTLSPEQINAFNRGLLMAIEDQPAPGDVSQATLQLQAELTRAYAARQRALAQENLEANKRILTELERRTLDPQDKLKSLGNNIYYQIAKSENSNETDKPTDVDQVSISYRGTLTRDGTVVDAALDPVNISMAQLPQGLRQALKVLSPNQSAIFHLPPATMYGSQGTRVVPPNAFLTYEISLHGISRSSETGAE